MSVTIRAAELRDVPAMAAVRARRWGSHEFWVDRIGGYLGGTYSPQQALARRAAWVAVQGEALAGFVAGHCTRRFNLDGELEWVNVAEEYRGQGIADRLIETMLAWFRELEILQVCVNVDPDNLPARQLYAKHGAQPFHNCWMLWTLTRRGKSRA